MRALVLGLFVASAAGAAVNFEVFEQKEKQAAEEAARAAGDALVAKAAQEASGKRSRRTPFLRPTRVGLSTFVTKNDWITTTDTTTTDS